MKWADEPFFLDHLLGWRDKKHRYYDAIALVRKYGKPDIFLTMTCNPYKDEILSELEPENTTRSP
jgi:hypothetical protein